MKEHIINRTVCWILTFVLLFIFGNIVQAQDSSSSSITISEPIHRSHVKQFGETIVFQSTVPIHRDYKPVVFIQDPLGSWWPYLTAKPTTNDRKKWKVEAVQFGVERDSGLDFKVQVVVLPEQAIDNGVTLENNKRIYIEAGETIKPREMRELKSKYMTVSNVIKVTRK